MSLLGKLMDTMRLTSDEEEEYYLDGDDSLRTSLRAKGCFQRKIQNMMMKMNRKSLDF